MFRYLQHIILTSTLLLGGLSCGSNRYALIEQAEEFSRQERFDEAISLYQEHIRHRLQLEKRAEWENPYFYLILIGDLQLAQNKIDDALVSYELAEKNQVDKLLVSDRYRYIASKLEQQEKLTEAIAVLTKYRDRDPLLYDLALDRLSKKLVAREDTK